MADTRALKNRILSTAEEEAEKTLKRAQQEAQEIIERAQKKAKKESQEMIEQGKKESQEILEREKTMAHLERRKMLLKEKQDEIHKVFSLLKKKIKTMDSKKYQKILKEMLLSQVEEGTEELILSREDKKRLGTGFLKAINQELQSLGKKGELTLSKETRNIEGGFILKSTGVENNNSFTEILAIQQDELETEVARILFKE